MEVTTSIILFLTIISSIKSLELNNDNNSSSPLEQIFKPIESVVENVQQILESSKSDNLTDSPPTVVAPIQREMKMVDLDMANDSSILDFVRAIPPIPTLFSKTAELIEDKKTKLNGVVNIIGDINKATSSVVTIPLEIFKDVAKSTKDLVHLESRSNDADANDGNGTSSNGILDSIPLLNKFGSKITELGKQIQLIKPGTKWCGDGNIARDIDDTGIFYKVDSCCRDHDFCPENIIAKSSKYNLLNDGSFTRSHCNCDFQFYKCLKDVGNPFALEVGIAYFDILKPMCFRFDFPNIGCKKTMGDSSQCMEFKFDFTKEKQWQWFQSPSFAL